MVARKLRGNCEDSKVDQRVGRPSWGGTCRVKGTVGVAMAKDPRPVVSSVPRALARLGTVRILLMARQGLRARTVEVRPGQNLG